jgi:hypothetical protein
VVTGKGGFNLPTYSTRKVAAVREQDIAMARLSEAEGVDMLNNCNIIQETGLTIREVAAVHEALRAADAEIPVVNSAEWWQAAATVWRDVFEMDPETGEHIELSEADDDDGAVAMTESEFKGIPDKDNDDLDLDVSLQVVRMLGAYDQPMNPYAENHQNALALWCKESFNIEAESRGIFTKAWWDLWELFCETVMENYPHRAEPTMVLPKEVGSKDDEPLELVEEEQAEPAEDDSEETETDIQFQEEATSADT